MIALLLVGLVASAAAAPQFFQHYRPEPRSYGLRGHNGHYGHLSDFVRDDTFDTNRFWEGLEASMMLENMLEDFFKQFPSSVNTEGVDGNEYKIIISLPNFEEKDIVVKAREGTLMVQATRTSSGGSHHSYLDIRTLPNYVEVTGSWTYSDDVLTIVFPVKRSAPKDSSEEGFVTVAPVTEKNGSKEDMEPQDNDDTGDADIGAVLLPNFTPGEKSSERGDKDFELQSNFIPTHRTPVEATTYAVDLNNEIEFVPVSMK